MRRFILLLLLTATVSSANGQYLKEFSQDTATYINELNTLLGNSLNDSELASFQEFQAHWLEFDVSRQNKIMAISQDMLLRSCRPKPHYIAFLRLINMFQSGRWFSDQFDEWLDGYGSMMALESTLLKEINTMNQTIFLLLDELKMFSSVSLNWGFVDSTFQLDYKEHLRVKVDNSTIIARSGGDSILLHQVTGYVDIFQQRFVGNSARVYWDRAGLSRDSVFAELGHFIISLRKPEYNADSVKFTHKKLLDRPVSGVLEDRISQFKSPENASYPRFTTYQGEYVLNDIFPGMNYKGAIAMQGANLAGFESEGKQPVIDIYSNDTLRVKMRSRMFLFGRGNITSNNAEVSVYIETDSIYHPDLVMNYNTSMQQLRLLKSKDYNSQGPYANSYHKVDMNFDELSWIRTEPVMKMQAALGTALGNGYFESYDFFNMQFFEDLQGMEYQHPLAQLWMFARQLGGDTFALESYASYVGISGYQIRHLMMNFARLGFVYFDFEADLITLRAKLYDYIDASMMQRDYDVMRFLSRTESGLENATLDLQTRDLTINGIPAIFLSDSQNVKLVPSNNQITMKRNRNFQFDGVIDAGLFKFYGSNFFFDYTAFLINLQNIDSLSISAKTGERNSLNEELTTTLDNKIENITGELLIDAPFNKSGLENFPEYPIFTSRENSYVYFDEPTIQGGVYDKNRFYFELVPFSIDSLDNFTREALKMEGTFVSADILPPLEMEMSLRPDNSLGFYFTTPDEGLPVYGGNATFYNDLEMSSAGLHGYGSFRYIRSLTQSDDFLFHPDSMLTTSRKFTETETAGTTPFPYVENDVTSIKYYPFQDVMHIDRLETPFKVFDDETFFGGDLALRPSGLSGVGTLRFTDARFQSESFAFQDRSFGADSAGVQLKDAAEELYAFETNDVAVGVDLNQRQGAFTSRKESALVSLPENLYEVNLDNMVWLMDEQRVKMQQKMLKEEHRVDIGIDSLATAGPTYLSLHPKQDSLSFVAPIAHFDYVNKVLDADKVPFMEIGDSYVFPFQGKVEVLNEATIKPLRNAKVMANKESRHHLLHSANLTIDSRLHFMGSADYDYIDEFGTVNTFTMDKLEVDTSLVTFGSGEVIAEDSMMLSPWFAYSGMIRMDARKPLLDFAGGVRLTHNCPVGKSWYKFDSEIDPDSIMIPVGEKMQNTALNNIYAGTLKARDSIHVYGTFLSGRKDYFDRNLSWSSGFLRYDKESRTYEIASVEKMNDRLVEGQYIGLQTDTCLLTSEGDVNLQLEYGRLKVKAVGEVVHDLQRDSLELRLMMGMRFHFSDPALQILGSELDSLPGMDPVDLTTDFYNTALKNLVGEVEADRLQTELGLYGEYSTIPDSMQFQILFNDVRMKWNQDTRSFRHKGKIGIGLVGNVQVNKEVDVMMQFVERGSGDIFDIYMEVDPENWYYMAYSPGGLQVLSSNREFTGVILEESDRDRQLKAKNRQPYFIYSVAAQRRMDMFLDDFLLYEQESAMDNQ